MLSGVDVSHHQGAINWARVASAGHVYAWCKASEGRSFRDSRFSANWAAIRANRMVRGAYHFLRSDADPAVQARHFLSVVGDLSGSMAALDVESWGASRPTAQHARAFAREFARLSRGHPLVIYTGRWYWHGVLGNPYGADLGPLWHSAYTTSPGPLYGGWPRFTFWQYTASGRVPGIAGNVDLNHFFGDRAALAVLTRKKHMPLDANDRRFIEDQLVRTVAFLTTGRGNALYNPSIRRTAFMDDPGCITLSELAGRLRSVLNEGTAAGGTLGEPAEVAATVLATMSPTAIAAAIPDAVASEVADELAQRLNP